MQVKAAGKTDRGLKRKTNQDCILVSPELGLYIIADGIGGHMAGEVASRLAVQTVADYWRKVRQGEPPSLFRNVQADLPEEAKHVISSITLANSVIHEAQKKPEYHSMGTTISTIVVEGDCFWSANVGDSPVYLCDRGRLIQVSEEHSLEAEQKGLGRSDTWSSTNPMLKNVLTRALGIKATVKVYITPIRPEPGDYILMSSDGLTNYVSEESIQVILSESSLPIHEKVNALINEANKNGGGDNISVIILEILRERKWHRLKTALLKQDRA